MRIAEAEGRETVTRVLKTDDFDVHETIKEMAWTSGAWRATLPEMSTQAPPMFPAIGITSSANGEEEGGRGGSRRLGG